jgi:hypothetical protein
MLVVADRSERGCPARSYQDYGSAFPPHACAPHRRVAMDRSSEHLACRRHALSTDRYHARSVHQKRARAHQPVAQQSRADRSSLGAKLRLPRQIVDRRRAGRRRGPMKHESRAAAGEGFSQRQRLAVPLGQQTRSINVDRHGIMATDGIRDPPHLDRVAPGFNISPEPGRGPARTDTASQKSSSVSSFCLQVHDEILGRVTVSPRRRDSADGVFIAHDDAAVPGTPP